MTAAFPRSQSLQHRRRSYFNVGKRNYNHLLHVRASRRRDRITIYYNNNYYIIRVNASHVHAARDIRDIETIGQDNRNR